MLVKCRQEWREDAEEVTKLDTYRLVNDFTEIGTMVKSKLPRNERSLMSRLLCGILPLEVETGHFRKGDKKERKDRLSRTSNEQKVEDELHFIFLCDALKDVRKEKLEPLSKKER